MAVMNKARQELVDMFQAALKENRLPWKAVWNSTRPFNPVSGTTYRGVNNLMLNYMAEERGYTDPRWCTFKQAQDQGWRIKAGSKAARVEYWSPFDPKNKKTLTWAEAHRIEQDDPERYRTLQMRCHISAVFNGEQITGIPAYETPRETNIDAIRSQRDTLLRNMKLDYREIGGRAFYSPIIDQVTLPPETSFDSPYGYLCTFLHECGHTTGHPSRLNRDLSGGFGSEKYTREELRAEIASAFVSQELGLVMPEAELDRHLGLHKAYIQSWAAVLENKPDELFAAIRDANKISDYLIQAGEFTREAAQTQDNAPAPKQRLTLLDLPSGGIRLVVADTGCLAEVQTDKALAGRLHEIREIEVREGITALGDRVFWRMPELETVVLPHSLEEIGYCAMDACPKLQTIRFLGSVEKWDAVHKAYGSLPEQFQREREIAERTRLSESFDRGPDDLPAEELGGIVLVAEAVVVMEEVMEEKKEQEAVEQAGPDTMEEADRLQLRVTGFQEKNFAFTAHVEGPGVDRWSVIKTQGDRMYVSIHTDLGGPPIDHDFTAAERESYLRFEAQKMGQMVQPEPAVEADFDLEM